MLGWKLVCSWYTVMQAKVVNFMLDLYRADMVFRVNVRFLKERGKIVQRIKVGIDSPGCFYSSSVNTSDPVPLAVIQWALMWYGLDPYFTPAIILVFYQMCSGKVLCGFPVFECNQRFASCCKLPTFPPTRMFLDGCDRKTPSSWKMS